jgi:hypothetical protein
MMVGASSTPFARYSRRLCEKDRRIFAGAALIIYQPFMGQVPAGINPS